MQGSAACPAASMTGCLACATLASRGRQLHRLCLARLAGNLMLAAPVTRRLHLGHTNPLAMRSDPDRLVASLDGRGTASERSKELRHAFDQPLSGFEHVERIDRALRSYCLHQRTVRLDHLDPRWLAMIPLCRIVHPIGAGYAILRRNTRPQTRLRATRRADAMHVDGETIGMQ